MHRPTLIAGLLVMTVMCLIPPFHTGAVDTVADAVRGEEPSKIEYRPVWSQPEVQDDNLLSSLQSWEIAGRRLLLQIIVVTMITLAGAYWMGTRR